MKKYTVILDNGYYMEIMADSVERTKDEVGFIRQGRTVANVSKPLAVIEDAEPDGYWFKHLAP